MENNSNYDYEADFLKQFEEKRKGSIKPVILVCGHTGSGKTSIAQAILGNVVSDNKIGHGAPMTQEYEKYENELVRVWDSKGLEPDSGEDTFIELTKNFIKDKLGQESEMADASNLINVFWYVIQGPGARVTNTDLKIIDTFPRESTIVVISKNDITKPAQLDAMIKKLIAHGIANNKIIAVSSDDYNEEKSGNGIEELMELTRSIMPEAYKLAFDEAQKVNVGRSVKAIEEKRVAATAIILTATTAAGATGAIPIPVADAPIITTVQVTMMVGLAALYSLDAETIKTQSLPFLASIAGKQAVVGLAKLIPIAGSVIAAGVAVALTGAMGLFSQNQFETIAIAKAKGETPPKLVFDFEIFAKIFKNYKKDNNLE